MTAGKNNSQLSIMQPLTLSNLFKMYTKLLNAHIGSKICSLEKTKLIWTLLNIPVTLDLTDTLNKYQTNMILRCTHTPIATYCQFACADTRQNLLSTCHCHIIFLSVKFSFSSPLFFFLSWSCSLFFVLSHYPCLLARILCYTCFTRFVCIHVYYYGRMFQGECKIHTSNLRM